MNNPNINANVNAKNSWKVIGLLMFAIGLWGAYHAVGAGLSVAQKNHYFGLSAWWESPKAQDANASPAVEQNVARDRSDFRRSMVVAVATFSFLAFWGAMLYSRQRRMQRKESSASK